MPWSCSLEFEVAKVGKGEVQLLSTFDWITSFLMHRIQHVCGTLSSGINQVQREDEPLL